MYDEPKINKIYDIHTFLGGFQMYDIGTKCWFWDTAMPILHIAQKYMIMICEAICSTCKRFNLWLVSRIKTLKPSTQCTIIYIRNSISIGPYPPLSFILSSHLIYYQDKVLQNMSNMFSIHKNVLTCNCMYASIIDKHAGSLEYKKENKATLLCSITLLTLGMLTLLLNP